MEAYVRILAFIAKTDLKILQCVVSGISFHNISLLSYLLPQQRTLCVIFTTSQDTFSFMQDLWLRLLPYVHMMDGWMDAELRMV